MASTEMIRKYQARVAPLFFIVQQQTSAVVQRYST